MRHSPPPPPPPPPPRALASPESAAARATIRGDGSSGSYGDGSRSRRPVVPNRAASARCYWKGLLHPGRGQRVKDLRTAASREQLCRPGPSRPAAVGAAVAIVEVEIAAAPSPDRHADLAVAVGEPAPGMAVRDGGGEERGEGTQEVGSRRSREEERGGEEEEEEAEEAEARGGEAERGRERRRGGEAERRRI